MKKMKRILSLCLLAALCLSLCACGGSKGGRDPEATPAPEYVYAASFTAIEGMEDEYLNPRAFTDEGFYVTTWEKVGEEIPEGVTPEYEGQYDVYESRLYFVGFDGSRKALEAYRPLPALENENNYREFGSGSNLDTVFVSKDGKLMAIENVFMSWNEAPAGLTPDSNEYWNHYKSETYYYLRALDESGAELSCVRLDTPAEGYLNTYGMKLDGEGNLVMGGENGVRAIAPDGSEAWTIEADRYIESLVSFADGSMGAVSWGEMGMELLPIVNGAFGEPVKLPNDAYQLYSGGGYDFYYNSGINFFGYDLETGTAEKLFNWIDLDVSHHDIGSLNITEDGKILTVLNRWDEKAEKYESELVTVEKKPYDPSSEKELLTLAALYVDYQVERAIIDFNRRSQSVRIQVKDYSEYNTDEDYNAGITKLQTEIMAGKVPDILAMNSQLSYTQMAAKGLLEDLYPWLDADAELSREDFFPNVLSALEVNGGLYGTCNSFQISTILGASRVVGEEPGWTYADFDAALAAMPEGCQPFDVYTTRDVILQNCLALDLDSFVDWASGQCRFDSGEFIQLLQFANRFPAEFDWEKHDWNSEPSTEEKLAQGQQMLLQMSLYNFTDIFYMGQYFGGDFTFIGYPSAQGTGNMFYLEGGYAMSADCKNKQAAWEFIRSFLTEDYQKGIYAMPLNVKVYEQKLSELRQPQYRKDAEGNYMLDENGERIPIAIGGSMSPDGEYTQYYNLTDAQVEKIDTLVRSTTKNAGANKAISDIVAEQAAAFFEGQKSAEEVARLIQSKVNIYVNEQR